MKLETIMDRAAMKSKNFCQIYWNWKADNEKGVNNENIVESEFTKRRTD